MELSWMVSQLITRGKLVHDNYSLWLVHHNLQHQNVLKNHFGCQHESFDCQLDAIYEKKKPLVDNQNDVLIYCLVVDCDRQVATNNCNGQVFFSIECCMLQSYHCWLYMQMLCNMRWKVFIICSIGPIVLFVWMQ